MRAYIPVFAALLSVVFIVSCEEEETPIPSNDNLYYAQFVINGDTIRYEDGIGGYGNGPGKSSTEDSLGINAREFTMFIRNADTVNFDHNVLNIAVVKRFPIIPTYEERYAMFGEGVLGFGSWPIDTSITLAEGVIVTYTDNDGKVWSSDLLFGTQPASSTFEITSHTTIDAALFGAKTRGTFNITLFDGAGVELQLSGGKFHARTVNEQ